MSFDAGSITATLELDRSSFQAGLDQARADADRFSRDPIRARLDVDTATAGTRVADWRRLQEAKAVGIGLNVDTIGAGVRMADWRRLQEAKAVDLQVKANPDDASAAKAGTEIGSTASAAAKTSTTQGMSGMAIAITGAIAAAAPFVGASLIAAVGVGLVGVAALVEKSNADVKQSYTQLGHDVVNTMTGATQQVVPQLVAASHALDQTFQALGPSITQAMAAAGPAIVVVTNGISALATNAMPGLVQASQASLPVLEGLSSLLGDLGSAVSETFGSLSTHSQEFGTDLASLGPIVRSVLGLATNLITDLGGVWAQNSSSIVSAIAGVSNALSGLASGVMPVLSAALGATTEAITAVTGVLGPLTPVIGGVVAAVAGGVGAFKLFQSATVATLSGFNAVAGAVTTYGNKLSTLVGGSNDAIGSFNLMTKAQKAAAEQSALAALVTAQQTSATTAKNVVEAEAAVAANASATTEARLAAAKAADTAATDALTEAEVALTAASEASSFAFGPLGIALVAVTAVVGLFAASQSNAKAKSDDLKQTTDSLTSAFEASHGAIDQGVISALTASKNYQSLSAAASHLGISQDEVNKAVIQGGPALNELTTKLQSTVGAHTQYVAVAGRSGKAAGEFAASASGGKTVLDDTGKAAQAALTALAGLPQSFKDAQAAALEHEQAMKAVSNALLALPQYQDAAASSAKNFGLSLSDVNTEMQYMITSGQAASTSVEAVTEALGKANLAAAQAGTAIGDHFTQADKAVQQASQSVADAQHAVAQAGQAVIDAQHGVAQAEQAVADAQYGAAQAGQALVDAQHNEATAADAVAKAEHGVADAQHNVVQAQLGLRDSYYGVTQAENAYSNALWSENQAQLALNKAREQAAQDLRDLHLQLADQQTSEADARLHLFDATNTAAILGVNASNAHAIASQDVTAANEQQVKAALDLVKAQNGLNDTLNSGDKLRQQVTKADKDGVDQAPSVLQAEHALAQAHDQVTNSAQALVKAHEQVAAADYALQQANYNLVQAQQAVEAANWNLQKAHQAVEAAAYNLQRAHQAVESAAYNLQKAHEAVQQAEYNRQHQVQALQQAQQNYSTAVDASSRSLDIHTAAGQTNIGMIYSLNDALIKTGMPDQERYATLVQTVADKFGVSKDKAKEMVDYLLGNVSDKDFRYNVTAVAGVDPSGWNQLLGTVLTGGRNVPQGPTSLGGLLGLPGHAEGGSIAGWSPHATADNIPIMATAGEYMQPVDVVQHYGVGFMDALRQKRVPRGGDGASLPGFADGGVVGKAAVLGGVGDAAYSAWTFAAQAMGVPHGPMLPVFTGPTLASGAGPGGGPIAWNGPSGVTQWTPQVLQALAMLGQGPEWLGTVLRRMQQESSGNPTIFNDWDINWQEGHPSVGLMQVIRKSFQDNAGPFLNTGPFEYGVSVDPLANIYAGLNYAIHRYGSLSALNQAGGYDNGGPLEPGYTLAYNGTSKTENVRTADQEDHLVTRLDRIEQALSSGAGVTVHQVFDGTDWNAEEAAAAGARHMTAAIRELRA